MNPDDKGVYVQGIAVPRGLARRLGFVEPDDVTRECSSGNHQFCGGYAGPWNDPGLCECECHEVEP